MTSLSSSRILASSSRLVASRSRSGAAAAGVFPQAASARAISTTGSSFRISRPLSLAGPRRAALAPLSLTHTSSRGYANPAGSTPDANADNTAELCVAIISELETLTERMLCLTPELVASPGWMLPLTRAETDFVNMGQVPCPEGCEVLALLDLSRGAGAIEHPGVGPDGKGVHVPLLALVGSTEPAVPCYPLGNLFGGVADSVAARVRQAVVAQRKAMKGEGEGTVAQGMEDIRRDVEDASLIALLVPPDGKRDLGLPLALALYRLAMAEGNGYVGDA